MSLRYLLKGQMFYMSQNGFEVTMISSDGKELRDVIENEECTHQIIPLTRKITPFSDLVAVFRLYLILVKVKPRIVHTHTPKAGIVGMIASFLARVPIRLHTVAGLPLLESVGVKRIVLNHVEKVTYMCSTKVYPNSYGLKRIIVQNGFTTKDKLKVIGVGSSNGIDTSHFNPGIFSHRENHELRQELGIEKKDFIFIFIGRLVGDKGINELTQAFNELCFELKDIKLLLVGPFEDDLDPLKNKTKLLISNHDKIISVGYQDDVRPYLAISHSLVFPSYREGFPNVVLQAGAMGLPSIVTDINGCNEIIKAEYNGIIIPSKDIESLKRAMSRIVQDRDVYLECSENARKEIVNNYEQNVFWNALLKEYESLVNAL